MRTKLDVVITDGTIYVAGFDKMVEVDSLTQQIKKIWNWQETSFRKNQLFLLNLASKKQDLTNFLCRKLGLNSVVQTYFS